MARSRSSRKTPRTPTPPPAAAPSGLWWRAALIALAGVLTYWNSLSGAFILDDQSTIVDNPQIRELWSLAKVLTPEPDTAIAGRPLVNLSFAINHAIGGLGVRGYHIGNIAIHIICALVAFGIVRRTIELPGPAPRQAKLLAAASGCARASRSIRPMSPSPSRCCGRSIP